MEHGACVAVVLVTQVRLYAEGIAAALEDAEAISRVDVEATCAGALARMNDAPAQVVVLDLAGIDDPFAARRFVRAARPANVVAFAVKPTDQEVVAWAEQGVTGILTLDATLEDLVHAIRAAADGECRCSPCVTGALMRQVAATAAAREKVEPKAALTERERQIAELLVRGRTNKQIASDLTLGVSTVKNHVHHLLGKVDARTRGEAAARLVAAGIQSPEAPRTGSTASPRA